MIEDQNPTETVEDWLGGEERKEFRHPAFAQIGAGRVSSMPGTCLYGSDFLHQHFIVLRIASSHLTRGLHRDWYHGGTKDLIEVALSESQWATMISSLNMGEGVPCTLTSHNQKQVPGISQPRGETEDYLLELRDDLRGTVASVDLAMDAVKELGDKLSRVRRDKILAHLVKLRQDLASNLPFLAESFGKHMERRVEKAKVEVAAYVNSAVTRAGLEALGAPPPIMLPPGEDES